jgi:hypothetical protein
MKTPTTIFLSLDHVENGNYFETFAEIVDGQCFEADEEFLLSEYKLVGTKAYKIESTVVPTTTPKKK